jgi:hypothetical protein
MSTLQDRFLTIDVGVNFSSRYSDDTGPVANCLREYMLKQSK